MYEKVSYNCVSKKTHAELAILNYLYYNSNYNRLLFQQAT